MALRGSACGLMMDGHAGEHLVRSTLREGEKWGRDKQSQERSWQRELSVHLACAHRTGLLSPAAKPVQVVGTCASVSLGLSQACVPSRSASRALAPRTVILAAWTDEDARVRAALASRCSWREKTDAGQGHAGGCAAWSRARRALNPHTPGAETSPILRPGSRCLLGIPGVLLCKCQSLNISPKKLPALEKLEGT